MANEDEDDQQIMRIPNRLRDSIMTLILNKKSSIMQHPCKSKFGLNLALKLMNLETHNLEMKLEMEVIK